MIPVRGIPYVDMVTQCTEGLRALTVPRTGQPLAIPHGRLTFFDMRSTDVVDIAAALPCIVVDLDDQRPVTYREQGNTYQRGVPLVVGILVPVPSAPEEAPLSESLRAQAQAHEDLLTVHGDVETLFTHPKLQQFLQGQLQLVYSTISRVDTPVGELAHVRARVSEIGVLCWQTLVQA